MMRGIKIWMALLSCCCLGVLSAQSGSLQFAEPIWNFGTVKETDGKISHAFAFTNTGKTPVVIEQVNVTCGCTTLQFTREPVRPGASGVITITYNPQGRPGEFRKDVTVQSSGGGRNVLTITGEVILRPETIEELYPAKAGELLLSARSVNLGYVPRGSVKAATIEYFNPTTRPLDLLIVYTERKPHLDIACSPERIEPQGKGMMTVSYDLRQSDVWGMMNETFSVMVNGVLTDTSFDALGVATEDFTTMTTREMEQAPKATFSSQFYNFANTKAKAELHREFTITNEGETPLIIRDMKLGPRMSTTLDPDQSIAPGERVSFLVIFNTQDAPLGKLMDHIVFIVNDPSRPMREIRLGATITE